MRRGTTRIVRGIGFLLNPRLVAVRIPARRIQTPRCTGATEQYVRGAFAGPVFYFATDAVRASPRPTARFNTYRFADHKARIIDPLAHASVKTQRITDAKKTAAR